MTEEKNQEKESKKCAFSKCAHKEDCFDKITEFTTGQIAERFVESLKDVMAPAAEWKIYYRIEVILLRFPCKQPQHVNEAEAERILELRKAHKYSVSDLAFIFDRSKATIHAVLKQAGLSGESE